MPAPDLRPDRCETCKFFEVIKAGKIGYCHRYPPPFQEAHRPGGGYATGETDNFPIVSVVAWCGEWQVGKK